MTLSPAAADTGVLFRAADGTFISASAENVVDTRSATTVGAFGVKVRSIEHLMAALGGLGIDNVLVDTDAEELPAADGSAKPFVDLLEAAGRASLPALRQRLVVEEPLRVGDDHRWLEIVPSDEFRISYTLDNSHPVIGLQVASFAISEDVFQSELAPARTYGFLRDVPLMRQHGLARGRVARQCHRGGQAHGAQRPACGSTTSSSATRCSTWWATCILLGRAVVGHVSGPQRRPHAEPPAGPRDPEVVRAGAPPRPGARAGRAVRAQRRPRPGLPAVSRRGLAPLRGLQAGAPACQRSTLAACAPLPGRTAPGPGRRPGFVERARGPTAIMVGLPYVHVLRPFVSVTPSWPWLALCVLGSAARPGPSSGSAASRSF